MAAFSDESKYDVPSKGGVENWSVDENTDKTTRIGLNFDPNHNKELFDRELAMDELFKGYRQSRKPHNTQATFVLITGHSGTGKTTLAKCLEPKVKRDKGYFIAGKCNELQRPAEPFAPFVTALSQFAQNIMNKRGDAIRHVQAAVTEESEQNLLIDIVPGLAKILLTNPSDATTNLKNHKDSQSPTILAVTKFFTEFCSSRRPMVLLLDDIQWLDQLSLELMKSLLLSNNMKGFTLIGTCRGNEVSFDDELSVVLRELETNNVKVNEIELSNLNQSAVQQMVAYILKSTPGKVSPLADIVYEETGGNTFYMHQFLRAMHDRRLIYTIETGEWKYDQKGICDTLRMVKHDDVLHWTTEWISQLPPVVQDVLKVCSCLGSDFEQHHVELAVQKSQGEVPKALNLLEKRGVLFAGARATSLHWAHDRFQQVAYKLIPETERISFHKTVGFRLLHSLSPSQLDHNAFTVANQLLAAKDLIVLDEDKEKMASLCLLAGQKAALASAFDNARYYFTIGIQLLPHRWEDQYDLTLSLHNAAAEMECCSGNTDTVDSLVEKILKNASSFEDKLRAYETQIYSLAARRDQKTAVIVGFDVLRQLGEKIPQRAGILQVLGEVRRARRLLKSKTHFEVLNMKTLKDFRQISALRIMHCLFPSVLRSCPNFAPLLAARCIQLTYEQGLSSMACPGFGVFGMLLCNPLGHFEEGRQCVELGLQIMERFNASEMKCRLLVMTHGYCMPYTEPIRTCLEPLTIAARSGNITGDIDMSCLALHLHCLGSFIAGDYLPELLVKLEKIVEHATQVKQEATSMVISSVQQLVLNFIGRSNDVLVLSGDAFDEKRAVSDFEKGGDKLAVFFVHFLKCVLAVYFKDYKLARQLSLSLRTGEKSGFNAFIIPQMVFLDGMAEIYVARPSTWKSQAGKKALTKLKELCRYSPCNVLNKIHLIEAERYVLQGKREKAIEKFDLSIQIAHEHKIIQEQALACERAGLALFEWGKEGKALQYLEEARALYKKWGSRAKVEQITKDALQLC